MSALRKIYSHRCWINNKLQPATIYFENGKITTIDLKNNIDAEDFENNIIMPGAIDAHVHVNEPGRTEWEGFETITQAAAAGGITTIIDMPLNASPVTTTAKAFQEKLHASINKLNVNVGFYGGLIPTNINDLQELIDRGVMGIKCFLTHSGIDDFPNVTEADLNLAMPILAKNNITLLVHCELESPTENNFENNPTHYLSYLQSRPKKWENDAIALMIRLCKQYNCKVHIVHVSSAEALSLIENAKKEGLPITAETCSQYIYFNADTIPNANCLFKCAPPIREKENNHQLKIALQNNILNFITTDHSPATPNLKQLETGNLQKAWGGIAGVQFLITASFTALKNLMTVEKFIPLITENPSTFLGLQSSKGKIAIGYDADLVIWNENLEQKITEQKIYFKHKISPYMNETLCGTIVQTIVNGITVFKNNKIINKNKGKWLIRK